MNIVLIGGSYGIGRSIAQQQIQKGNSVWIASRTMDESIDGALHLPFDAFKEDLDLTGFPEQIDGLVYCPGSINLRPFTNLRSDDFREDMEINFFAMVRCVQALLPRLKKSDQASLVLFSTVAVQTGLPFHTSVSAAKGAIEGFARALAAEMAPRIRVNVVAPSLTDTPLASKLLSNEKSRTNNAERHPLKRLGTPEDIASMVGFLLEIGSSWMTGQTIQVDGGMGTLRI
ncbi:MAG: SDR family oxidoreductase [Flavobacteriales bacterium]|nr:SDR family oxidoreductase [Flavobacteriales bacterium]